MTTSRRTTLKALGTLGAGAVLAGGSVYAVGEHDDDERADENDEHNGTPQAGIRVVHAAPDAPNVDVYVDDEQVLTDVPYEEVSPYLEVEPGTYSVKVTAAGDEDTVVYDEELEVGEAFYTLAAIGELEDDTFEVLVLTDAGSSLVRLLHASPDAPDVDVRESETGAPLFETVGFGESTNYVAVPAGSYTLEVVPSSEANAVEDENGIDDEENGLDDDENGVDDANDDDDEVGMDDDTEDVDTDDDENGIDDDENGIDDDENGIDDDENGIDDDENGVDDNGMDEDDDMDEPDDDVVASVDVDLEAGTAYTAFAIGYLEPPNGEGREFAVNLAVDGPESLEDDVDDVEDENGIDDDERDDDEMDDDDDMNDDTDDENDY
ncbi:DUF4397 domain-containing protein [Halobacteria archaeon AArc-curdl1]|uniref:DUF4397 domain-containing protein n=1 Tax=Natronosalvus hydrolyticus TaxID=2979988 RepID=A0AAP3E507_9EURY|nr:DUF4397 domain-containing protein [Halobacteria archaeon AArc-curdl1]